MVLLPGTNREDESGHPRFSGDESEGRIGTSTILLRVSNRDIHWSMLVLQWNNPLAQIGPVSGGPIQDSHQLTFS